MNFIWLIDLFNDKMRNKSKIVKILIKNEIIKNKFKNK